MYETGDYDTVINYVTRHQDDVYFVTHNWNKRDNNYDILELDLKSGKVTNQKTVQVGSYIVSATYDKNSTFYYMGEDVSIYQLNYQTLELEKADIGTPLDGLKEIIFRFDKMILVYGNAVVIYDMDNEKVVADFNDVYYYQRDNERFYIYNRIENQISVFNLEA